MNQPDFKLPSGKELVVLEMLCGKREMYGLQMIEASEGKLKRGAIYVLLSRMEDKGYLKSWQVKEPKTPGMPKRMYKVTGLGQRAYAAWRQAQAVIGGVAAI